MAGLSLSEFELKVSELADIESIVKHLPAFANYDSARIRAVAGSVRELLDEDEGMEALCGMIKQALPPGLSKTAYAVCCDVPATGAFKRQRELSFLLELRQDLDVDRLTAAAIDNGCAGPVTLNSAFSLCACPKGAHATSSFMLVLRAE